MPLIREVLSPPGLKQLIEPLDFTPETDLESSMASLLSEKERGEDIFVRQIGLVKAFGKD
jgi:hypothetical protein